MNTAPSKRELRHFLKRYVPDPELSAHLATGQATSDMPQKTTLGVSPKEYVNTLLSPNARQVALTKVEGPLERPDWLAVGSTLLKLRKLGLTSIVVFDNIHWRVADQSPSEASKTMMNECMALVEAIEKAGGRARPIYGGVLERRGRDGALDVHLDYIKSALEHNQVPVLVPVVSEDTPRPIPANEMMVALTKKLAQNEETTPAKIIVINTEGGIPNHEQPGTAHSLVNVQEEYDSILDAFNRQPTWHRSYPTTTRNLNMIRSCLAMLPTTSSAIVTPISSLPSSLIANLVTDKPLYSSSLPAGSPERINSSRTTVLRHGIKINKYDRISDLDLPRLTKLLEASFLKKLDEPAFYGRLEDVLAGAIIAGDYEGAVIMTSEQAGANHHAYLDKFAIAPTSQGIGLTDILWKQMCDAYPELLWRSRKDNGVNKW